MNTSPSRFNMGGNSKTSRLHRLIDDHLQPYTMQNKSISLSKGDENKLLIALSQIYKEIHRWNQNQEIDYSSDSDSAVNENRSMTKSDRSANLAMEPSVEVSNLYKLVGDLMFLASVKNPRIQHMTGNALIAVAEFIAAIGENWELLVRLLFICAQCSITYSLSPSLGPVITRDNISSSDIQSMILAIKPRLRNANWSTVAGIFRVLRCLLKFLKQEDDEQLIEVYLKALDSFLATVSLDLLDEICASHRGSDLQRNCAHAFFCTNIYKENSKLVFVGYFVQLLCSAVELMPNGEAQSGCGNTSPLHSTIISLVPRLLHLCLGHVEGHAQTFSIYFRHKLLILMIRLNSQTLLKISVVITWLQLLNNYFQDFLWEPITRQQSSQSDSLEDSPFLARCPFQMVQHSHRRHLKRQVTFLFLSCIINLINYDGEIEQQCGVTSTESSLLSEVGCCNRNRGFLELSKWLQVNLPTNAFSCSDLYWHNCISVASSFVRLFIHEDDLLFKVLLQLLGLPFLFVQEKAKVFEVEGKIPYLQEDIPFHVSNLFNPIILLHLFLAEIQYDHQVLLDYIISKDVGTDCVEYLLRCLRLIGDSWEAFMEFPKLRNMAKWSTFKRRKVLSEASTFLARMSSSTVEVNASLQIPGDKCKGDQYLGCELLGVKRPYEEAKRCFLSLKDSVENLHCRNLFPYNPTVLLKRLTKFQELCCKHMKYNPSHV